jgi:4-hydroxy-tetrahydrodipicolinate synthase
VARRDDDGVFFVEAALRRRGGVARAWELQGDGIDPFFIELAADKRQITRLRQGWYGVNDLDPDVSRAIRLGGTLACRSALQHHGVGTGDGRLHVAMGSNSPRELHDDVVVHWTRTPLGRRIPAVSVAEAERQAARCAPASRAASLERVSTPENPFGQVLVALVTPFTADGEVLWADVEKHIDDVINDGADGIVVTGTTGETSTLTDPEKIKLVEVAKSVANGRAKVITGGGSNETAHAIELYKHSEAAGADGVMIVTPYYNKPTQAGVLTHFRMIADATDLPVILYDIPGRTGIPIKYETILRAAKHPNIRAVKDAKGDLSEVSRVLNQTDLIYFAGDDAMALPTLAIGGTGVIGVTANIAPAPYRAIIDAVNRNDLATATAEHKALEPLVRAVMTHVPGTVAAKYILHGLGRISSPRVRLPLVGPEESEAALIEDEIALVGDIAGLDFSNFRPDRNAAAGGALPKVAGTTR